MKTPPSAESPRSTGRYNIRAIERAIAVLNAFSFEERKLSLKRIAAKTGLSKPTVFRVLATLQHHRYVTVDCATSTYCLGSKFLELGGIVLSSLSLRGEARPHLDRLRDETQATVLLATLMEDQLVYVDKRESPGPIRVVSDIGWRRSPHFGMLGMTLMAYKDEAEVNRLLQKFPLAPHTQFSLTDRRAFFQRLRETRTTGCTIECNEAIVGVCGIAAPIRGTGEDVIAAVGVAIPLSEKPEKNFREFSLKVKECASAISQSMGYSGSSAG